MTMKNRSFPCRWLVPIAIGAIFTSACAAPPDRTAVDRALNALESAESRGVFEDDSLDLEEARRHLDDAQRMLADGDDQELIDHQAEMARLRVAVAETRAEANAASREIDANMDNARLATAETRVAVEVAIRNAQAVDAKQTERGLVLTLGGVLFAFNSADLTQEARLSVARVAGFLIALENREALVEGHADSSGERDYNDKLSQARADSILAALVESGVSESRLVSQGYGSRFPVASNDTAEGRERNRRVEIVILRAGLKAGDALR